MDVILIAACSLICSTAMIIFWVVKGGFNKRFLYTDNILLSIVVAGTSILLFHIFKINIWLVIFLISPFFTLVLFILLLLYRFFRNPKRIITQNKNEIVSPADGRIIYIKELEANQVPVSVKKLKLAKIDEITKTDILQQPCYLIGIAMTLFDVHMNRAPLAGKVILVKHTPGQYLGLNTPESTLVNERNTIVIERADGVRVGVVQIAARLVRRCIVSVKEGEQVEHGGIIGRIRWGSQADLIMPRNCEIMVREGDQVYAGSSVIGRLIE